MYKYIYIFYVTSYQKPTMISRWIRTFGYKVRQKTIENDKFGNRPTSLKNNNPDSKADFWKKIALRVVM